MSSVLESKTTDARRILYAKVHRRYPLALHVRATATQQSAPWQMLWFSLSGAQMIRDAVAQLHTHRIEETGSSEETAKADNKPVDSITEWEEMHRNGPETIDQNCPSSLWPGPRQASNNWSNSMC